MGSDGFSVGSIVLGAVIAVGSYYFYKTYIKNANKSEFEKAVDRAADSAKRGIRSAEDSVDSFRRQNEPSPKDEVMGSLNKFGKDVKSAAEKLGDDLRHATQD